MKLLAHSVVPTNPVPYLHLGYLSAYATKTTTLPGATQLFFAGVLMIAVGLILLTKRSLWRWACMCLALGIGMGCLVYFVKTPPRYLDPGAVTTQHTREVRYGLITLLIDNMPVPDRIEDIPVIHDRLAAPALEDGWMQPLRLVTRERHGATEYGIASIGKDGKPGTRDDRIEWVTPADVEAERKERKIRRTRYEIDSAPSEIERQWEIHERHTPSEPPPSRWPLGKEYASDAWNRPYRITTNLSNEGYVVRITSAGPDGTFGTTDDITAHTTLQHVEGTR